MTRKVQGKEEQKTDEVQYAVLKAHDNAGYSSIAQSVEHAAVNRAVVGSSPTRGVFLMKAWLHGQAVKTSPFHGGNTGSIPVGVIFDIDVSKGFC